MLRHKGHQKGRPPTVDAVLFPRFYSGRGGEQHAGAAGGGPAAAGVGGAAEGPGQADRRPPAGARAVWGTPPGGGVVRLKPAVCLPRVRHVLADLHFATIFVCAFVEFRIKVQTGSLEVFSSLEKTAQNSF